VLAHLVGLSATALVFAAVGPTSAPAGESQQFGIASFSMQTTETNSQGVSEPYFFNQAGGHPFALTNTIEFSSSQDPKDVIIDLPAGMVANPQAIARCSGSSEHCPTDSQVGVFELRFAGKEDELAVLGAIVNMTPYTGQAAELGLEVPLLGRVLLVGHLVRTPQGYGLSIIGHGLPALDLSSLGGLFPAVHLTSMQTTLWGVPADAVHDPQRGISCLQLSAGNELSCQGGGLLDGEEAEPFLTMGSDCSQAPTATTWVDSWEEPGRYAKATATLPALGDCERLPFWTELTAGPDRTLAEEPLGLDLNIKVRQTEGAAIVAAPQLREATITLPQGMSINPGIGDGAKSCGQSGPEGINIPTGLNSSGEPLAPGEVGPGEEIPPDELGPGEPELVPGHCPEASVLGTAEALTPLLAHPIKGRVYLATPGCGGQGQAACTDQDAADGNLYRIYVELGGRGEQHPEGVIIKLEGHVQANPATGQLTVKLTENPQLPISELDIDLFGGTGALLTNPQTCGAATTTSDLQPWSAPYTPDASPSSYYDVTGCANSPLNPEFLAGSINAAAGASTRFTLTVSRSTGEPFLSAIQAQTPPGLSAMLSSVPLCEEALASTGKCPEASRVGSSEVAVGDGSAPLYMPGNIYLTAGYEGAPFGLSILTDAQAGPLNLGRLVIRARVDIDPVTAALRITTDPLPQVVLGVPLRIQRISLDIDRPHFILNPTNCEAQQITARIAGTQGASADVSNRFELGDCASLAFKPKLSASTGARSNLTTGASLALRLTFPRSEQGTEANLARIRIALPKHLPSRLTTLQSSCPQATFNKNPAACPSASIVGAAIAQTPILPGQLSGPVYFVTHGHDAFPSPVVILQGDGVTLSLSGSTVIEKTGTVSVTFDTIPDVPMERLELDLPQGAHSLVIANTNLCALSKTAMVKRSITKRVRGRTVRHTVRMRERLPASLPMPTEFAAHNGAVIHQTTQIEVVGCSASKIKTPRRLEKRRHVSS
jgi:hypothetical protein